MIDVIVRRMAPTDWRKYRDVRLRALQDSPGAFGTRYVDVVHNPDSFWQARLSNAPADKECPLFAEVGEDIAGLAWGTIESPEHHEAHLFHMWVAPQYRGQGVGRGLIDAVASWATSFGVRTLRLSVACGNSAARRLYESAGFRPVGEPESMRPDSEVLEQPMERELTQGAA